MWLEPWMALWVWASSLRELEDPGLPMKFVVGAFGSSPYMLRAFHRRSISHDSLARIAFISAAEANSDVGRAVSDGLRSRRTCGGGGGGSSDGCMTMGTTGYVGGSLW